MSRSHVWFWFVGIALGAAAMSLYRSEPRQALAGNDRHDDFIMCTGQIQFAPNFLADTVWLLDYRAGKLLGTVIDRNIGKVWPWKEVDLVQEFKLTPKQNVHFMMTTGNPNYLQAGLQQPFGFPPPANPQFPLAPNNGQPTGNPPPLPPTTNPNAPPPDPNAPTTPPPNTPPVNTPPGTPPPGKGMRHDNMMQVQQPQMAMNTPGTLYVAETQTGRFAVYTIALHPNPGVGLVILRHDATRFRAEADR